MTELKSPRETPTDDSNIDKQSTVMKYMGLGAQFFVTILIMLAIGWKLDQWAGIATPLFIWVLPLLAIVGSLVKIIVETNKKSKK